MQTTDDILFSAHAPDPIPSATTEIVGTPGNARNVYWIVSHFPIGSVVSGPFPQKDSPNVLDDENYVHISWPATLGASSYDLLFTWEELQLPRQPGRFLLAANLTSTEFRDTGQDLDLYDLAGIRYGAPQQEWIYFDNRDRKQPTLRFIPWPIEVSSIIFEDGSSLSTAGAAGGAAPPNQSVQFNNNGAFGGSPNLIWDGERLDVNALVRVSNRFVSTSGFGVEIGYDTVTHWGGIENFNYDTNAYEPMYMNGNPVLLNHPAADGSIPGYVGIGVNNPVQPLHISNSRGLGYIRLESFSPDLRTLYSGLEFYTSGNYVAEIGAWVHNDPINDGLSIDLGDSINNIFINHATGYVGINTGNPQYRLDVLGQAADPIPSTIGDAIFAIRTNTGISLRCGARLTWPYDPWVQGVGTTGNIYINPLFGGVLIGGTDPTGSQSHLVVTVPANGPQNVATFTSYEEPRVWFGGWAGIGAPQGQMTFMTSGGNFGAWVERMRIDGIGNVGIGTPNPQAVLDVNGIIRSTGQQQDPTSGVGVEIFHRATVGGYIISYDRSAGVYNPLLIDAFPLILNSTSVGRVGIGRQDPQYTLDVLGDINLTGRLLINGVQVLP